MTCARPEPSVPGCRARCQLPARVHKRSVDTAAASIREHRATEQIHAYIAKNRCGGADDALLEPSVPAPERAGWGRVLSEALVEFCLKLGLSLRRQLERNAFNSNAVSERFERLNKFDVDVLTSVAGGRGEESIAFSTNSNPAASSFRKPRSARASASHG